MPLTGHDIYVLLVSFHPAAAMSRAQDTQEIDTHTHPIYQTKKQKTTRIFLIQWHWITNRIQRLTRVVLFSSYYFPPFFYYFFLPSSSLSFNVSSESSDDGARPTKNRRRRRHRRRRSETWEVSHALRKRMSSFFLLLSVFSVCIKGIPKTPWETSSVTRHTHGGQPAEVTAAQQQQRTHTHTHTQFSCFSSSPTSPSSFLF